MLEGVKQEGTSDVAYSRNQPSVLEDDRELQRQRGARSGAGHTSNPKRVADFRGSQVCDSRTPRCTGQRTLGTAPMMVLGRRSSTRVQNRREPRTVPELERTSTPPTGSSARESLRFVRADERALASVGLADGRSAHSRALGSKKGNRSSPRSVIALEGDPADSARRLSSWLVALSFGRTRV